MSDVHFVDSRKGGSCTVMFFVTTRYYIDCTYRKLQRMLKLTFLCLERTLHIGNAFQSTP
jgi:hypothetical protein